MMQSMYIQRIMKKNAAMGYKKTNPEKPKISQSRNNSRARNGLKYLSACMAVGEGNLIVKISAISVVECES